MIPNTLKYHEAAVLGTGTLALRCAQLLKEKGIRTQLFDTGDAPSALLARQAGKKGLLIRRLSKKELADYLTGIAGPTLLVSAINPWLLPKAAVENPHLLAVNCHQALLPAHPGRNAEMWAIYEGDKKTGVTWHKMAKTVDAGDILIQKKMLLTDQSTSFKVFREQCRLAEEAFEEIVDGLLAGTCRARPQKGERGKLRYSYEMPENGLLSLSWPFGRMSAFLRAYDYGGLPVPIQPYFYWDRERYRYGAYRLQKGEETAGTQETAGRILAQKDGLRIVWPEGCVELQKLTKLPILEKE